eukprot:TRINITY_DN770_c0_g1_i1.p2 TRINITY_DN770_c0_g1~~TRINITY_DN770_c0_g1_i1.p2  ORF type:complete len:106 (-),score=37.96 TRINITY_DN770_c0_g1_i1:113-430(-)
MVHEIKNKAEFDSALAANKDKLVVIDFSATWCGPCKMISPKFEEMSKKFTDIACFKVDVDEAEDVAAACGITAMPTFQFFKNGAKVAEFKGANAAKLEETIVANK